jgi:hypothetical protein
VELFSPEPAQFSYLIFFHSGVSQSRFRSDCSTKNNKYPLLRLTVMEKNIIKQQLELIEKLLKRVNSRHEYFFLLGAKEALLPFRYSIELKGGDERR